MAFYWFDLQHLEPVVERALTHHASQLTTHGDGTLTHSAASSIRSPPPWVCCPPTRPQGL